LIVDRRFIPFKLNELITKDSAIIEEYVKNVKSVEEIADRVIRDVEYPFFLFSPDDRHSCCFFHGRFRKTVKEDYWQNAAETCYIKAGDCEDSSILFCSAARCFGVSHEDVYVVFGVIREAGNGRVLGGHAWCVFKGSDGKWHLMESTLDTPPVGYPVIPEENLFERIKFNNVIYEPQLFWNDKCAFNAYNKVESVVEAMDYMVIGRKHKENLEKYEAISSAWGTVNKPFKSYLSRRRKMDALKKLAANCLFVFGWTLSLWDLYETILTAGDTPWRLHHGWVGLALTIGVWLYTNFSEVKEWIRKRRQRL